MTIGIAVSGRGAGLAAFRALAAAEKVARGAIGGFVSFAVIDTSGILRRAQTQRGGTATLFTQGETTGVLPPPEFADAPAAVLMSSGPDRPEPLAQFTPGDAGAGLVSGHRLPNMPGSSGRPLNLECLGRLQQGETAEAAVAAVLSAEPEADAGLIAIDRHGGIALGNTAWVAARGDLGEALRTSPAGGVGILHNAIHPHEGLADFLAAVALDSMAAIDRADFHIAFKGGVPLRPGPENCAAIDATGRITAIEVTQAAWLGSRFEGAALGFHAAIRRNGELLGHAVSEPYCVACQGQVVSMSGSGEARIGVRALRGDGN